MLANFLVELPTRTVTNEEPNSTWLLHIDRSSSKQGSGIGIRLTSLTNEILEQSFKLEFHASNYKAEYEALIAGLRLAHGLKIHNNHTYYDSQLVASQYSGEYEAQDETMDAYLKLVQNLAQEFDCFALTRIPHSKNVQVDALAALASSFDPSFKRVIPVEFIEHPSIRPPIFATSSGIKTTRKRKSQYGRNRSNLITAKIPRGWKRFEPTSPTENYFLKNGRPAKSERRPRAT